MIGAASARAAVINSTPSAFNFQGYLADPSGAALTGVYKMRFAIVTGGTRVWYAEYDAVNVTNGYFAVSLGSNAQSGTALNPADGSAAPASFLPISPALLSGVSSSTSVEVDLEIWNGASYDALSPPFPIVSSLFALKADTIDGYDSSQLAKLDSSGNIIAASGTPVISPTGAWIGPPMSTAGSTGTMGVTGWTGARGMSGGTGSSGATGVSGSNGLAGTPGAMGFTGVSGANGVTGASGVNGFTGASGAAGSSGAVGATGASGAGVTGSTGATGVGFTGASGTNGQTGATGAGFTGASGVNGQTGATGAGFTGQTGSSGAMGSTGVTGAGFTGTTGATGAGSTGASGANGLTGASGANGTTGASGANGTTGASGANGTTGASGTAGATGATGLGATGATGASITGPTGTSLWAVSGSDISYSNGNVGIGTNVPGSLLTVSKTETAVLASEVLTSIGLGVLPVSASSGTFISSVASTWTTSGNLATATLVGQDSEAQAFNSANVGTLIGGRVGTLLYNAGSSPTVGDAMSLYVISPTAIGGATLARSVGALIQEQSVGTQRSNLVIGGLSGPTGTYSIYNASPSNNYFAGNLGIGTTSPTNQLHTYANANTSAGALIQNANSGASASSVVQVLNGNGTILMMATSSGSALGQSGNILTGVGTPLTLGSNSTLGTITIDTSGNTLVAGKVGIGTTGPAVSLDLSSRTDAIGVPAGTTGQRPATPVNGMLRYNSTLPALEGFVNGAWQSLATGTGGSGTGITGSSGVNGAIGATGATGAGVAGATGVSGANGATGSGSTGASGAKGATGATGVGVTGPTGGSLWGVTGSDMYYTGGKIGIGTANPNAPLHVAGNTVILGIGENTSSGADVTLRGASLAGGALTGGNMLIEPGNGTGGGGSGALLFLTAPANTGTPTVTSDGGSFASASTLSFTVANNPNRLLIVTTAAQRSASAVTYGGVALTRLTTVSNYAATMDSNLDLWYLVGPAVGTATISVSWSGGTSSNTISASAFHNVSQTTPFGTPYTTTFSGNSASATTNSSPDGLVYDAFASSSNSGNNTSISAGGGQTQLTNGQVYSSPWGSAVGTSVKSGAASVTTSWSSPDASVGAYIAVNINSGGGTVNTTMTERVRIANTGNVGIGTSNPLNTLDVTGVVQSVYGYYMNVYSNGSNWAPEVTGYGSIIYTDMTNGGLQFATSTASATAGTSYSVPIGMTLAKSGSLGIGSINPGSKLDVGVANAANVSDGLTVERGSGATIFGFKLKSDGSGVFRGAITAKPNSLSESEVMTFNADSNVGYVGIGTTSPGFPLHVVNAGNAIFAQTATGNGVLGTATSTGTGVYGSSSGGWGVYCGGGTCGGVNAWTNTSDRRLKSQVEPIASALEKILRLDGVTYHWSDRARDEREGQKIGLIAQDVEKVFPQVVKTDVTSKDHLPGGTKSISYAELVSPIIAALKEFHHAWLEDSRKQTRETASLRERNEKLQRELEALRAEKAKGDAELKARLERLEQRLSK